MLGVHFCLRKSFLCKRTNKYEVWQYTTNMWFEAEFIWWSIPLWVVGELMVWKDEEEENHQRCRRRWSRWRWLQVQPGKSSQISNLLLFTFPPFPPGRSPLFSLFHLCWSFSVFGIFSPHCKASSNTSPSDSYCLKFTHHIVLSDFGKQVVWGTWLLATRYGQVIFWSPGGAPISFRIGTRFFTYSPNLLLYQLKSDKPTKLFSFLWFQVFLTFPDYMMLVQPS